MTEKNIVLIGLGPHARRIYYPLLEKHAAQYGIHLRLVVDLQDQEERICAYLAGRALQPEALFFASPRSRNGQALEPDLLAALDRVVARHPDSQIIISTEPKAHKKYALWAIERGLDMLMDKPLTAPIDPTTDLAAARQVFEDFIELESRLQGSGAKLFVQCQRRSHAGYRFIWRYLDDFVRVFQIPISYLDIYHADGMWPMPHELFHRENHPYKYGYGKLMHSGYHFVDLLVWLAEINNQLEAKRPERADLFAKRFCAYDLLHQVGLADYRRLFATDEFDGFFDPANLPAARGFGELDVYALCQFKCDDAVVTTASLNLQQNSFCRRSWVHTPEDVYKGNGRVRHERLNVQVGNLLSIQAHSYQSYEVHKKDVDTEGAGHEDHFDIYVFRNSGVVGGAPLEKFRIGEGARSERASDDSYLGHNEDARERNLVSFLEGRPGAPELGSQRLTNRFLSKLYECMAREHAGDVPYLSFSLAEEAAAPPLPEPVGPWEGDGTWATILAGTERPATSSPWPLMAPIGRAKARRDGCFRAGWRDGASLR